MNIKFICIFILLYLNISFGQTKFEDFLEYVNSLPNNQKGIVVDSFLAVSANNDLLFVEDGSLYIFYLGEAEFVYVTGIFNEENGFSSLMNRIPSTDLHYYKWHIPDIILAQFPNIFNIKLVHDYDILANNVGNRIYDNNWFNANSSEPQKEIYYYNIVIDTN